MQILIITSPTAPLDHSFKVNQTSHYKPPQNFSSQLPSPLPLPCLQYFLKHYYNNLSPQILSQLHSHHPLNFLSSKLSLQLLAPSQNQNLKTNNHNFWVTSHITSITISHHKFYNQHFPHKFSSIKLLLQLLI